MKPKLIELWKPDCEDCEAAKPVIAELEKEGFKFKRHNIFDASGYKLWEEYTEEIDAFSRENGWEEGYIYTPTFINPKNRKVLAFADCPPTREELINLAKNEH
jgi:thiol-disulfide isomerase/thioredoxin